MIITEILTRISETLHRHMHAAVHRNAAILSSELSTISRSREHFMMISQMVQVLSHSQTKNRHTHPQIDTIEKNTTFATLSHSGW